MKLGARRLAKSKLVLIEWWDASSPTGSSTWSDLEDIGAEPVLCRSVGWVLEESDRAITLCSTHMGENRPVRRSDDHDPNLADRGSGIITIPKVCIQRRRVLSDP